MDAFAKGADLVTRDLAVGLGHFRRQRNDGNGEGDTAAGILFGIGRKDRRHKAPLDGDPGGSAEEPADRSADGGAGSTADDHAPDAHAPI